MSSLQSLYLKGEKVGATPLPASLKLIPRRKRKWREFGKKLHESLQKFSNQPVSSWLSPLLLQQEMPHLKVSTKEKRLTYKS